MTKKGKLYLIPNTLGETDFEKILPSYNIKVIEFIRHYIVEDLRNARRFLSKTNWKAKIDELSFYLLNEHSRNEEFQSYLSPAEGGKNMGLLSEAGTPCVADPGADIVAMAHQKGIQVIPLIGPSSILLSLMASGFNGQNFAFVGYLPRDKHKRSETIKRLEHRINKENQTQIFIEAPYRNNQMLHSILQNCSHQTKLCVARDITLDDELIISKSIAEWNKTKPLPELHKRNTIFLLYT
jgi:16S rRNA (cytidine1402-2'-O)-methyltransferase